MSRQRLGQHFLGSAEWRARIAREIGADASPGTSAVAGERIWLEIGAGHGEMTRLLARSGARVVAVEVDPKLLDGLQAVAREFPRVQVVAGDILTLDLGKLMAGARFSVYGNLPYYITSPILHRLFEHSGSIEEIYVVIQLEVAARLTAHPGTRAYAYLSVLTQYYAKPEIVLRIPPGAFRPPPKVMSALVHMRLPGENADLPVKDEEGFFEFVKRCFAQKRKKLTNNLRGLTRTETVESALHSLGIRVDARAEQLNVTQFVKMYQCIVAMRTE